MPKGMISSRESWATKTAEEKAVRRGSRYGYSILTDRTQQHYRGAFSHSVAAFGC